MVVHGSVTGSGDMRGEILLGTQEAEEDPGNNRVITLPFTGNRMDTQGSASAR